MGGACAEAEAPFFVRHCLSVRAALATLMVRSERAGGRAGGREAEEGWDGMGGSPSAHDTGCCSTARSTLGAHAHVPPLTVRSRCVAQADHIVRAFGADELSAQLEDWAHGA